MFWRDNEVGKGHDDVIVALSLSVNIIDMWSIWDKTLLLTAVSCIHFNSNCLSYCSVHMLKSLLIGISFLVLQSAPASISSASRSRM